MVGGAPATARFVNPASATNDKPSTAIAAKVADAKVTNAPNTPTTLPLPKRTEPSQKQPPRAAIAEKVTKRKTAKVTISHDTYRKHANAARASYSYYLRNDAERSLVNAKKHIEILKKHGYAAKIEADTVIIDNYKKPTLTNDTISTTSESNPSE